MAPYVLKIKYGDVLRRIIVEQSLLAIGPDMSFSQLEDTIRLSFKLPVTSGFVITYTDKDGDVVTMTGEHDLHDACVLQGLNPLRLTVTVPETLRQAHSDQHGHDGHQGHHGGHQDLGPQGHHGGHRDHGHHGHHDGHWDHPRLHPQTDTKVPDMQNLFGNTMKMSMETAKQTMAFTQQVLQACEPLIKRAPSTVVSEVMDTITKLASSAHLGGTAAATTGATFSQPGSTPSSWTTSTQPAAPASQTGAPEQSEPRSIFAHPHIHSVFSDFHPSFPSSFQAAFPAPGSVGLGSDKVQATGMPPQAAKEAVQHRGVQCDMCGMVPIVGTRYKSNKKHDYDLCQNCFQDFGKVEDYTQIERPLWRPRHMNSQIGGGRMRCPAFSPHGGRPSFHLRGHHGPHGPHGSKSDSRCGGVFGPAGGKLDARFVQDVTIFDGTEFAPETAFTKIWRLRNSGSCAWPKTTRLMHVGGDELGCVLPVNLELPEGGLAPDGEAEVSVDLVAPAKPGRYVSHWRLVSPTGQKFGHRVWVLIQVVPKDEQSPQLMKSLMASSQSSEEDTKLPEQGVAETAQAPDITDLQPIDTDVDAMSVVPKAEADDVLVLVPEVAAKEPEGEGEISPGTTPYPEINMEALTLDPVIIDAGKIPEENTAVEDSELGNFSMVNMPITSEIPIQTPEPESTAYPRVLVDDGPDDSITEGMKMPAEVDPRANSVDAMLATLESMGFKQRDVNQEVLKKNGNDLQRTLDDLVMAVEWDPMLEELEEMGFYDTDMNRLLMFKNNGSIKRVVKELVQMYKDPKGKEQA